MELIDRARAYVAKMPVAVSGSGGHNATFHVACVLVQGFCLSQDDALTVMREYNAQCSPPWSEKELMHKLKGADRAMPARGRGFLAKAGDRVEFNPSRKWNDYHHVPAPSKKDFDAAALAKFSGKWAREVDLVWLANRSRLDPANVSAGMFLGHLYEPGEKVAVFTGEYAREIGDGLTMWPDVEPPTQGPEPRPCGVWYLAQPVDGRYHATEDAAKVSCRSRSAVTSWRYMVIESDEADTRQWLGAIVQLPLRIAALYSSGGRSVHALVRVDARTESEWNGMVQELKRPLAVLGADPKTLTSVRLTRLPGCLRHGKMKDDPTGALTTNGKIRKVYERFPVPKQQKLLYLNPRPELCPLIDYFTRRDVVGDWCKIAAGGVADNDETGGAWIERGLSFYAGVSSDCAAALAEFREAV